MMTCAHNRRMSDNHGVSCQDCGVKLEGYGYGGTEEDTCIHHVVMKNGDECIYCHRERLALPSISNVALHAKNARRV